MQKEQTCQNANCKKGDYQTVKIFKTRRSNKIYCCHDCCKEMTRINKLRNKERNQNINTLELQYRRKMKLVIGVN